MQLWIPIQLALVATTAAQNFVQTPKDTESVPSKNYPGASISYKQTEICETTPGVKAYSGYVNLPSTLLADVPATYNASIFFWYFQARHNPDSAPLAIYIGGGPGTSGMDGSSGFPCRVQSDTNSTVLNEFSWNDKVNMLYIDQPVSTGFSYSTLANGIIDLLTPLSEFTPVEDPAKFAQTNVTTIGATISLPDPSQAVLTTMQAARTMWHFAQLWFQEFPEYTTSNREINIWSVSYGGYFAPAIFAHFEHQNDRIANTTLGDASAKPLKLGTVGLQNACIDAEAQGGFYPEFAYNNTYGIQAISKEIYDEARNNFTKPGGCLDLIHACRAVGTVSDPLETGLNTTVNEACATAALYCFGVVQGAYTTYSNLNPFDITYPQPTTTPTDYNSAFFNRAWVQSALGVPINFTLSSNTISILFFGVTGDPMRRTLADLSGLAARRHPVTFVYGDRDYRCNWLGGENVSLSLQHAGARAFRAAGYAPLRTNATYDGGVVRQAGGVAFVRVFQAGHSVAAYQPETVLRVFERSVFGRDVATGTEGAGEYTSVGEVSSWGIKNEVPETTPEPVCLVYSPFVSCAENQVLALADGTAVTEDFVVIEPKAAIGTETEGKPDGDSEGGNGGSELEGEKSSAGRGLMAHPMGIVAIVFVMFFL
ncbi:Alpha/Beta hydrolase protein [Lasiosphaeria hispida]|uniref:Alpha/Beta hydrolase protein n=1 Tax=Lasiosphaeria hispida TaxID=260671 RepID=A0AAJ0M7K9_9PEZI|nr:Alpha/Beta hydrolase protein [Lasiosphaeria hispida]